LNAARRIILKEFFDGDAQETRESVFALAAARDLELVGGVAESFLERDEETFRREDLHFRQRADRSYQLALCPSSVDLFCVGL